MQEIGSEFLLDDINISTAVKSINNCIFLENGRQCFKVVADKVDGQILFPAYACESMIQNINPNRIIYYDVDKDFNIDFNSISQEIMSKISIFVFVDYYGFPQSVENIIKINALKNKGVLVVEDITHSVFSEFDFIGDVLICSMRKWFGMEGLGLLYSEKINLSNIHIKTHSQFSQIRKKAFLEKKKYFERTVATKNYLSIFNQAELYADSFLDICSPTKDSLERFNNFDFASMKEQRKKNYLYLQNHLDCKQVEIIKYLTNETPLFFPIYAKQRNELRKYLIEHNIFCPIHWPKLDDIDERYHVHEILANIISIPIDQRYENEDMQRIINVIRDFYKEV